MKLLCRFIKEKLQPVVTSEEQLIFACHLIGPTLARFNVERPRCIVELSVSLYEMLEQVDRAQTQLKYMDPVCDLLYPFFHCEYSFIYFFSMIILLLLVFLDSIDGRYHIKYMFVGDMMKTDVECIIRRLRPALQMRLRFIAHLNIEEIQST